MKKEITVSPEELYYLGVLLRAEYIDYAYIASMGDVGRSYPAFENEVRASLVNSGILAEDFSGNPELDETVVPLLFPVFFGETETCLDVCSLGKENVISVNKFHFYDDSITMVTCRDGKLVMRAVDGSEIERLVSSLLPADYICTKPTVIAAIDEGKIQKYISAKSIHVGKVSVVKTFVEVDGVFYGEKDDNTAESYTRGGFLSAVNDIIKGA